MIGFIYILVSPAFRNVLKIGMTERSPEERATELSNSSGVPTRFFVAYEEEVSDCSLAEGLVHEALKDYRINEDREFFQLPLKKAIEVISRISSQNNLQCEQSKAVAKAEDEILTCVLASLHLREGKDNRHRPR